jgi:hypothetical protein
MRATYAASASSLALNPKETGMEEDGDVRSRPPDDRDGGADAARRFAAKAGEYGERARIGDGDRRHAAVAECTASTPRSYKSKPPRTGVDGWFDNLGIISRFGETIPRECESPPRRGVDAIAACVGRNRSSSSTSSGWARRVAARRSRR